MEPVREGRSGVAKLRGAEPSGPIRKGPDPRGRSDEAGPRGPIWGGRAEGADLMERNRVGRSAMAKPGVFSERGRCEGAFPRGAIPKGLFRGGLSEGAIPRGAIPSGSFRGVLSESTWWGLFGVGRSVECRSVGADPRGPRRWGSTRLGPTRDGGEAMGAEPSGPEALKADLWLVKRPKLLISTLTSIAEANRLLPGYRKKCRGMESDNRSSN